MKRLINLMRYDLNLYGRLPDGTDGVIASIPPSGETLVVSEEAHTRYEEFSNVDVDVTVATVESILGPVPSPAEGIAYVVPMRTLLAMREKGYDVSDVYAPNMLVMTEGRQIAGCRRLMQIPNTKGK
jgi:hypothetical protein